MKWRGSPQERMWGKRRRTPRNTPTLKNWEGEEELEMETSKDDGDPGRLWGLGSDRVRIAYRGWLEEKSCGTRGWILRTLYVPDVGQGWTTNMEAFMYYSTSHYKNTPQISVLVRSSQWLHGFGSHLPHYPVQVERGLCFTQWFRDPGSAPQGLQKPDSSLSSRQIDGLTVETVTDFNFLGSKITPDGGCSHEIKRHLLLGRKAMINLDSILKSRDITLLTKVCLVKARRRKWQPTPVFLPGESQGWRSLVGCHLWGRTESDTTEAT